MTIGNPPPVYEMPTEKAFLHIEVVSKHETDETISTAHEDKDEAIHEEKKPGFFTRITRRLSGYPIP
jgi:methylase of polypeptide subunit release factors